MSDYVLFCFIRLVRFARQMDFSRSLYSLYRDRGFGEFFQCQSFSGFQLDLHLGEHVRKLKVYGRCPCRNTAGGGHQQVTSFVGAFLALIRGCTVYSITFSI